LDHETMLAVFPNESLLMSWPKNIIVVGASTGGIKACPALLAGLGQVDAAILLVQHMPAFINMNFARRLSLATPLEVKLAEESDAMEPGLILVAPSETHCILEKNLLVRLQAGPKVNFVCPSIDVAMRSIVAPEIRQNLFGVVLTGMGKDGAAGIRHLKQCGAVTFAQDKNSSAVFGMPAEAITTGSVDYVLPPQAIGEEIQRVITGAALPHLENAARYLTDIPF
jgi:two-component system chemotaxis response regulator CheB